MNTLSDLSERELVDRIRTRLPPPPPWLAVGIGDDAAVVEPERNRLEVLSVDALVEGIHFDRRFTPPEAIGHRALAVNLSDLAAMGARPRLALLSLVLPPDLPCGDFDLMISGVAALGASHKLHVIGGNLTRSPGPLMIDITVAGTVKRRRALTRAGARPGDALYVTGSIGAAAAGLAMLRSGKPDDHCTRRYLYPEPRVQVGLALAGNRAASACVDLSDGLADGVRRIAEASGVGVTLDADAIPIEPAAREWLCAATKPPADVVTQALVGGDDYELLFAVRPQWAGRLRSALRHADVPWTRVGACTDGGDVVLRREIGGHTRDEPIPGGFSHFR